ncbi:alpha/beta hydrolase [Demequina soli]|uniref:alpha/beta hydrolase n=1 Tax=Demequina soli TaxID=1638987 RepID=UPI000782DD18|nr:alpha/beta hydrolase [Demequina soli]
MASEMLTQIKAMMAQYRPEGGFRVPGPGDDAVAVRAAVDAQGAAMPVEAGVIFVADALGGVEVERSRTEAPDERAVILYIHGGGFAFGNATTSRAYASVLAAATGLEVVSVSYRLAPEHPFPAAPEDCAAVYAALVAEAPARPVVLVGESAGATLAIVTALIARDRGLTLPACVYAMSPLGELATELPSRVANGEADLVLGGLTNDQLIDSYAQGADLADPYLSPVHADFTGFPPLRLFVDRSELLHDDTLAIAQKAREAGVSVEVDAWTETFHSFPTLGRATPESAQILDETVAFIRASLEA